MDEYEMTPIEEIRDVIEGQKNGLRDTTEEQKNEQGKADTLPSNYGDSEQSQKSIAEIGLADIKVKLNDSKSYSEQAEDVIGMMTTAEAIKDDATRAQIAQKKKEELVGKATMRVKEAQTATLKAETEVQKAEREAYEGILETFGFFRHLPHWLTKLIVAILTPFLLLLGFIIGLPCGMVKILIENIDSIILKYENTGDTAKPRIKVTVIIIGVVAIVVSIALVVLKCLKII